MSDKNYKEIIRKEYQKCVSDPVYFLKKYSFIQHPIKGKIPFALYDFQEKTVTEFTENRFQVILKARQLGISTLTAGYALWMMTFQDDKNDYLFHGSPMENWYSILNNGLKVGTKKNKLFLHAAAYGEESFIRLLPEGALPDTKHVAQTNHLDLAWRLDRRTGRLIVMSAIDNLVKGASGQAIQCLNILHGWEETTGLI